MRELKPCGTPAAYQRHVYHGEEPCEQCKRAMADKRRVEREKKRAESVSKVQSTASETPLAELDPKVELRAQYELLGRHLLEAPPQSVAAISKERRAILEALMVDEPVRSGSGSGGVFDELAQRRKSRRSTA